MTKEEIIDLLTLARVYDGRVTIGKAETAAWYLALNRVPAAIGHQAVVAHYTAPCEPGQQHPRILPAHVMSFWHSATRYDPDPHYNGGPMPALPVAKASPEHIAECRDKVQAAIIQASAKFALRDADPDRGVPRWRPGMDKRKLAIAQVEAARRERLGGAS